MEQLIKDQVPSANFKALKSDYLVHSKFSDIQTTIFPKGMFKTSKLKV